MVQRYDVDWCQQEEYKDDEGPWVTYEDYQKLEAELEQLRQQVKAPDADGWIEWAGGDCPLHPGKRVHVKFSSGDEDIGRAEFFVWSKGAQSYGVIAYRVVKP